MIYVLNHDFLFSAHWQITKDCRSIHFGLVTLIYEINFISYKKQSLQLLLPLSFKVELHQTFLKIFLYWFWNLFRRGKTLPRPLVLLKMFGPKVSTIPDTKKQFFIFVKQSNWFNKFWIKNLQLPPKNVHKYFWWCDHVLISQC